jgi:hypothetical protein
MKNTQKETELLQTIRKWETLCDESLADAAHWKTQAKDSLAALKAMLSMFRDHEQYDDDSAQVIAEARAAIAKAENVK